MPLLPGSHFDKIPEQNFFVQKKPKGHFKGLNNNSIKLLGRETKTDFEEVEEELQWDDEFSKVIPDNKDQVAIANDFLRANRENDTEGDKFAKKVNFEVERLGEISDDYKLKIALFPTNQYERQLFTEEFLSNTYEEYELYYSTITKKKITPKPLVPTTDQNPLFTFRRPTEKELYDGEHQQQYRKKFY